MHARPLDCQNQNMVLTGDLYGLHLCVRTLTLTLTLMKNHVFRLEEDGGLLFKVTTIP